MSGFCKAFLRTPALLAYPLLIFFDCLGIPDQTIPIVSKRSWRGVLCVKLQRKGRCILVACGQKKVPATTSGRDFFCYRVTVVLFVKFIVVLYEDRIEVLRGGGLHEVFSQCGVFQKHGRPCQGLQVTAH